MGEKQRKDPDFFSVLNGIIESIRTNSNRVRELEKQVAVLTTAVEIAQEAIMVLQKRK